MWKKLKRLFRREAHLSAIRPKVTPDPATAARLAQKHTSYVPADGFLKDRRQGRKHR